jgi:flagellar basal body rod protein FlgC
MPAMSNITAIAASGLQSASARFEASAKRMVSKPDADLAGELVTQKLAELDFEANVKLFNAANDMMKKTLDILA